MRSPPKKPKSGSYPIGYGRRHPILGSAQAYRAIWQDVHAAVTAARADMLALKEAYRLIAVREGEETLTLPTIQAAMRQLARIGLKGNGAALRSFIEIVQTIEQGAAIQSALETADEAQSSSDR